MMAQGIKPETAEWDRRWTNYVLGHGATYDIETGNLIAKKDQTRSEERRVGKEC